MPWTNVSKPSVTGWTSQNPVGKSQYDQADIAYDSAATFYDGGDPNAWTNVSKPSVTGWTNVLKPS